VQALLVFRERFKLFDRGCEKWAEDSPRNRRLLWDIPHASVPDRKVNIKKIETRLKRFRIV
jgi:hypothetical protein